MKTLHLVPFITWTFIVVMFARLAAHLRYSFDGSSDFIGYHLPKALSLAGRTRFHNFVGTERILDGYPPLAHLMQSWLLRIGNDIWYASAVGAVGFLSASALMKTVYRERFCLRLFWLASLMIPLVVIHLTCGYIDLWNASWIMLCAACLFRLTTDANNVLFTSVVLVGAGAIACLSKMQSWPIVAILFAGAGFEWFRLVRAGRLKRRDASFIALATIVVFSAWPARNLITYGNPTYPYAPPFLSQFFLEHSTIYDFSMQRPARLDERSSAYRFAYSALEINRVDGGKEKYSWNCDQGFAERSSHQRMGGWFPITLLFLFLINCWLLRKGLIPRRFFVLQSLVWVVVANIPQSHELRYWMALPLCAIVPIAAAWGALGNRKKLALEIAALGIAGYVAVCLNESISERMTKEMFLPAEVGAFWKSHPPSPQAPYFKVPDSSGRGLFFTGPTFSEYPVELVYVPASH